MATNYTPSTINPYAIPGAVYRSKTGGVRDEFGNMAMPGAIHRGVDGVAKNATGQIVTPDNRNAPMPGAIHRGVDGVAKNATGQIVTPDNRNAPVPTDRLPPGYYRAWDGSVKKTPTTTDNRNAPAPIIKPPSSSTTTGEDGLRSFDASETTAVNNNILRDAKNDVSDAADEAKGIIAGVNTDVTEGVNVLRDLRGTNKAYDKFLTSLDTLEEGATKGFDVDRTIANRTLNRFDASTQAANLADAQRRASDPTLTAGARNSLRSEALMLQASQRSELSGQLAQQAQERSFQALNKLVDASLAGAEFEEGQYQNDVKNSIATIGQNLNKAISEANITMEGATLEFDIAAKIVDNNIDGARLKLDQLKAVAIDENAKAQIKQNELEMYAGLAEGYSALAANAVLSVRDANPGMSDEDVVNDPYVRATVGKYFEADNPGETFDPDSDPADRLYLEAFVKALPQPEKAQRDRSIAELVAANVSPEVAERLVDEMTVFAYTGLLVKNNEDGSISYVDPITKETTVYTPPVADVITQINTMSEGPVKVAALKLYNEGVTTLEELKGRINMGPLATPEAEQRRDELISVFSQNWSMTTLDKEDAVLNDGVLKTPQAITTTATEGTISVKGDIVKVVDSDGKSVEYKFDAATDDVDSVALRVFKEQPNSLAGKNILSKIVSDVKETNEFPNGVDVSDPIIYNAIAKGLTKVINKPDSRLERTGNTRYLVDDLESINKGQLINVGGRIIKYVSKIDVEKRRTIRDFTKYIFEDAVTGKTVTFQADRNNGDWHGLQ